MYIPSYDFEIFDIPSFSPLMADEFGASTSFSANTPTGYLDRSINLLTGLTQPNNPLPYIQNQFPASIGNIDYIPYFQETPEAIKDRLRRVRDQANVLLGETPQDVSKNPFPPDNTSKTSGGCPAGYRPVSVLGIFSYCGKALHSDDTGATGDANAPPGMGTVEKTMNAFQGLPSGSGIFLIAIVVIILLLLFVRR